MQQLRFCGYCSLEDLVNGNNIEKIVDENIVMMDIEKSADNLWSFLLFTGY
jgi:hypothetical protein